MSESFAGDRLAKVIARAGLCSRRDAEDWIRDGRVAVNGKTIRTPAFNVTDKDRIAIDGNPLTARQGTRVWLYHKPAGLVVTEKDPEGRETVFQSLEAHGLPRVVSIGRLDINTEGLLLLTNDGGLKRVLELPATGWLRRYRVRAFGEVTQPQLDALKSGTEIEGVQYGPIEALLERQQGSNVWLQVSLREGKNREVKNVLAALGLQVNRLIRVSFGPFQLNDLPIGAVEVVKARILREQLGKRLADEAGVDFDSELPEPAAIKLARTAANPKLRTAAPGKEARPQRKSVAANNERFHFIDRADRGPRELREEDRAPRQDRPGGRTIARPPRPAKREEIVDAGPPRKIHFTDGRDAADFATKTYGKKPGRGAKPEGGKPPFKTDGERPFKRSDAKPRDGAARPKSDFGKPPRGDFGDRPKRPYATRSAADGTERPKLDYPDRPKGDFGDRPKRPYAARSAADGAERPKRDYADKPKRDFGDRPKRPYVVRPAADGAERPKRDYADKPKRDFGDRPKRPYATRSSDAADGPKRSYAPRTKDDAGRPARSFGGNPKADFAGKPRGPRPAGDKPFVKRPRGSGPGGDRPRRPHPPKA
ncbi:MAG: pseudouridine synthase [Devosia sp.]